MFLDQFKNIDLEIHGIRIPKFKLSQEDAEELGVSLDIPNKELFKLLIEKGFKDKLDSGEIPKESYNDYKERLDYEVGVVEPSDFVDYFLEVWQDINLAKKNGIPIGPGRGCLSGTANINTQKGVKLLKDIEIGDRVINSLGELDAVINKFEYEYEEDLVRFGLRAGCNKLQIKMTQDHKVFVLKNPFKINSGGWVKKFQSLDLRNYFDINNAEWIPAKQIEKNDYLIRYVGRAEAEVDIENIDLAPFADRYDDQFVYQDKKSGVSLFPCLNIKEIHRATGISANCLLSIKLQRQKNQESTVNRLVNYLGKHNFTLEDFRDFESGSITKIPRYLKIDEDFCYILGFYIGDGWNNKNRFAFGLHSETDKLKQERIEKYFSQFGLNITPIKHKQKKLIQLYINCGIFANLFKSLVKNGSSNKLIPLQFLKLPKNKLKGLLDGLIDSDGHRNLDGRVCFDSTSFGLVVQVRWLFEFFGSTCSINVRDQEKCQRSYKVRSKKSTGKTRSSFNSGEYVFCQICDKTFIKNEDKKVYDISVKNDPSYHTLDYIVHNSAAGSLMLYVLGITKIDSLKYGLYFERFLSESRLAPTIVNGEKFYNDAVDIDTDISDTQRVALIDLLKKKHDGHFCKVSTLGTLQGKKLIKEVCKIVLGYSEQQATEISSQIPTLFGKVHSLKKAVEEVPSFAKWVKENQKAYKIALKLSELICSRGSHASAYILSRDPLLESVPCEMGEDEMVTSLDMDYVMMYNIKLDLLGLKAVSIVDEVCKNLKINESEFVLDYENVYQHLQDVKCPYGLFQISGSCNHGVVNTIKPKNIDHLAAVVAISRPGALQFCEQYAKFVETGSCDSVHPFFDEVLKPTASLALYQESAVQMCEKLGLSKVEGESVRRGISKKKKEEIQKWESVIFEKAKEQNLDPEIPKVLWRILSDSASYSFNRCLLGSTLVYKENSVEQIRKINIGDKVKAYNTLTKQDHFVKVINIHRSIETLFEYTFENDRKICCSLKHKFLTKKGMKSIKEIHENFHDVLFEDGQYYKIKSYVNIGSTTSFDLEVNHEDHNFYANGFVTSNSHSYSYGTLAAQTVFLKFKYPQQFFLACLKIAATRGDFLAQFEQIQHELPYFGIRLLPPNIVKSGMDFQIEGKDIRFGIAEIKGISDKSLDKLKSFISNKKESLFEVFNAAKESKLGIGVLSALIQSGALGHEVFERSKKVLEAQIWNLLTPKEKLYCLQNEQKYNSDLIVCLRDYLNWTNSEGKKFTKESRLETIRKQAAGYFKIYNLNHKNEILASYFYEKNLLGFSYSTTLKMIFGHENPEIRNIQEINEFVPVKGYYELVATVKEVNEGKSKNGNYYLKVKLSDETGEIMALLLGDKLARYLDNEGQIPKEDDILYLVGNKGEDILWVNKMEIQNVKVYTRLSELKNSVE